MNVAKMQSTDDKVFCPACKKQFLAIPGAECFCACGTAFRISLSKEGIVQLAVSRRRKSGSQVSRAEGLR